MSTTHERPSDGDLAADRNAAPTAAQVTSADTPHESTIYDVVIVGYGPAGVTAANFAAQLGLKTLIIERDTDVFPGSGRSPATTRCCASSRASA